FNRFNDMEARVNAAEQVSRREFSRFEGFQSRYAQRAEEVQREKNQWADAAYADIDDAMATRLEATRRAIVTDTTDANGIVRLGGLSSGDWWVVAWYDLP